MEVHLSCCKRELPFPGWTVPVSGDDVDDPAEGGLLNLNAPASQNMFNLLRGVTCAVRRRVGVTMPEELFLAGRLRSGS